VRLPTSLIDLATNQYGVVSRHQLTAAGIDRQRLYRLVHAGRLEPKGTSCFGFAGQPETWRQLLTVGTLDLGDRSLVAGRSAAALLGLDGFPEGPLAFLTARDRRNRTTVGTVHSNGRIELIDRAVVEGFACTSAARTIVDLAAEVTETELGNAVDSALRLGWTSELFLRRQLRRLRHRGRTGVRLLDRVLDGAGGHSWLERQFLALVRQAGLERPTCQRIHEADGRFVARTDFTWDGPMIVAELNGHRTHSSRQQLARDAQRHGELGSLGWLVLTFTYAHVTAEPAWVLSVLDRSFRSRSVA
jgi:very-short-patch-repair endonuclease